MIERVHNSETGAARTIPRFPVRFSYYVVSMVVITVAVAAAYLLLNIYIKQERDGAETINMAGRQRMLSQQIALMVTELRDGDSAARERILQAADLMERSHLALTKDGAGADGHLSPSLQRHYFEPPDAADTQVRAFIAQARAAADGELAQGTGADFSSTSIAPLLARLDHGVTLFQEEANSSLEALKRVEWVLLAAFLLALLAQTVWVVASLVRNNTRLRSLGRDFMEREVERQAAAQHNFAALLDAVPDATFVMQAGGQILLANAEAERLFGYGRDELVGRSIESLMPDNRLEDFRAIRPAFIEKLDQGPFTVDRTLVARARDGREFATEVRLSPLETQEGQLVLAGVRDVADRELERENQSARDEYLRLATERSGVGVWHWKIDDDDFQWSDAFRQIFGINAALKPSNEAFRDLIHPDDLDRLTDSVSAAIRDHEPYQLEYRIVRPDGVVRNIAARGSALYDDQGKAVRMTGLVQDITSRKEAEEALRASEERFRRIFEEGPMGIALVDSSSRFVSVNETLCQMVGYTAEELYALTFKDITHPDDLDADVNLAEQVFRGDIDHYDIQKRYFVKTGGVIWINLTVSVLRDMAGGVSYALAMIENITERKRLEDELEAHRLSIVSSARLSAIGSMAGGIAHEINNPVAIISASAENIEDMVEDSAIDVEELALNAKRIGEMCDRISKIVNSMRHISREGEGDLMHAATIRSIVDGTLALCAERYKLHSIRLDVPVIDPSAMIVCREVQVSQVLLNLLQNAFDAVVADAPDAWVRLDVDMLEDTVEFRVVDSGTGIGEDIKAKIMEPFFTTKPVGKGTGLGLSLSSTIAQQHGGRLEVGERDGHTCFTLVLSRMKEGQKSCN